MTRTWFITGASRGIGRSIAEAALAAGNRVVATARDAGDVRRAFPDAGASLLPVELDVTDRRTVDDAVASALDAFGAVDVLVNNAGYGQLGFFETLTAEQLQWQYDTNVFGLFNVTRAVLPHMRRRRAGHLINLSSIGGAVGFGGAAAYTSSKFAIEGFSEDMAIDLEPFGIDVTVVEPGFFRTDFLEGSSVRYGDVAVDDYADAVAAQQATYGAKSRRQPGDPAKLAKTVVALVDEAEPPFRLALGSDAVQMTRDMLARRLAELDRWEAVSNGTDHDDARPGAAA